MLTLVTELLFIQQDDFELWEDIIQYSLDVPDLLSDLLDNLTTKVNAADIIQRVIFAILFRFI